MQTFEESANSPLIALTKEPRDEDLSVQFRKHVLQTLHGLYLVTYEPAQTKLLKNRNVKM